MNDTREKLKELYAITASYMVLNPYELNYLLNWIKDETSGALYISHDQPETTKGSELLTFVVNFSTIELWIHDDTGTGCYWDGEENISHTRSALSEAIGYHTTFREDVIREEMGDADLDRFKELVYDVYGESQLSRDDPIIKEFLNSMRANADLLEI